MNNKLTRMILFLALLFCTRKSSAQLLPYDATLVPGWGCDAAFMPTGGGISFPFTEGTTFGQLTYLSTKFNLTTGNQTNIELDVWLTPGFIIKFYYYKPAAPNTWLETGNLISTYTGIEEYNINNYPIYTYEEAVEIYGSFPVARIIMHTPVNITIDDSRINNTVFNYDDCDNDGMLDYYDCDPSVPQAQKMKICHNGNAICINNSALSAHLAHGDYQGPCVVTSNLRGMPGEETPDTEFSIYPTLATSHVTIQCKNDMSLGTLSIFSVNGAVVHRQNSNTSQATIDIKNLPPGVYLVRSDQMKQTLRFVKQ